MLVVVINEIYDVLLNMLPFSAVHHRRHHRTARSGKVVIITGLPIVMALSVTFGTTVLLNLT